MLELLNWPAAAALLRRWPWPVALAVALAVAGAAFAALGPARYAAAVDLVPTRALRIDAGGPNQAPWVVGASVERRQAMAQLVRTPDVERDVQRELGAALPEGLRGPGQLLPLVRARAALRSEVITVVVEAGKPDLAADVARAWGRAYERKINAVYGSSEIAVVNEVVLPEAVGKNVRGWATRGALVGLLAGAIVAVVWPLDKVPLGGLRARGANILETARGKPLPYG